MFNFLLQIILTSKRGLRIATVILRSNIRREETFLLFASWIRVIEFGQLRFSQWTNARVFIGRTEANLIFMQPQQNCALASRVAVVIFHFTARNRARSSLYRERCAFSNYDSPANRRKRALRILDSLLELYKARTGLMFMRSKFYTRDSRIRWR